MRLLGLAALLFLSSSVGCDSFNTNRATSAHVTVAIFGDLEGVLEPCGCTNRPAGGVARLAYAVQELRKKGPIVLLAAGQLFEPPVERTNGPRAATRTRQSLLKTDSLVRILRLLAPDIVATEGAVAPIREVAGHRVGLLNTLTRHDLGVRALRRRGAKLVLALGESAEPGGDHAEAADTPDVVVHSGTDRVSVSTNGQTIVVRPGRHAEALTVLRLVPKTAAVPWRLIDDRTRNLEPGDAQITVLTLDNDVPAEPNVRRELSQLYDTLDHWTRRTTDEVDETREPSPFTGARTCAACHTSAYLWWTSTPHARAYRTLDARHRAGDVDCISCHVTGFGQAGGADFGRLYELAAVGCESCHGPGRAHADDPQTPVASAMGGVPAATCLACHDTDHSDNFDFDTKRQQLLTRGHGAHVE